jgi:hypothetical protein
LTTILRPAHTLNFRGQKRQFDDTPKSAPQDHSNPVAAGCTPRLMTTTGESDTFSRRYFSWDNKMTDPKVEASQLFKQPESAPTMNEYQTEQLTIQKNRERLKAERLAREAKG